MPRMVLLLSTIVLSLLATTLAAAEPRVEQFSPQGAAKRVRQVTARFSDAMVPLGDPRAATDVFEVSCPEPGTARWADSHDWVYDFARDLPAGLQCTFRLRPEVRTLDGTPIGGRREFAFTTGGPSIKFSRPSAGSSWIDEEQAFVLALNAEASERSVLAHGSFAIEGVTERVGVRIVSDQQRQAILETMRPRPPDGPVIVVQARRRFPGQAK